MQREPEEAPCRNGIATQSVIRPQASHPRWTLWGCGARPPDGIGWSRG